MMIDQETNHQGAHGHIYNMSTRFKALVLFFPPSSRVPRFHQGGNLAHFLGKHAQVLGPGGAWLETGVTELRSFEGVFFM